MINNEQNATNDKQSGFGLETLAMKLALENGVAWKSLNESSKAIWLRHAKIAAQRNDQVDMCQSCGEVHDGDICPSQY